MTVSAHNIWLIPALPLLAAAIGAFTPRRGRKLASGVTIVAMAAAFVLSVFALKTATSEISTQATWKSPIDFLKDLNSGKVDLRSSPLGPEAKELIQTQYVGEGAARAVAEKSFSRHSNFTWFDLGSGSIQLGFLLDPLAGFMLVMVTFVGLLIFIFSLGYMKEDANFTRFFCFLSLFAAAMLGLIIANSLLLFFICWELVGVASYLLIGFWFHKPEAAAAAKKAFITTRIGDIGLFLGMLWLSKEAGTLLFYDNGAGVLESVAVQFFGQTPLISGVVFATPICVLIFCGAIGKSGQFPLHVWLPDAMEGPTPVSALIHAATMVAAGVFLMARVYPLLTPDALTVIAFVGAITALMGAVIAVAQNDIKRVLAFSTVSQLGYMMLAIGVQAWPAAIFHLLTHAFFKALLFLGAGSVIHAAHHEQDIRKLGGLSKTMRVTFATFAIGMMALSGVPFLFSGFWSKEAILHAALGKLWNVPFAFALVAVVLTAFYMTRLVCEVFLGRGPRELGQESGGRNQESVHGAQSPVFALTPDSQHLTPAHAHVHESPAVMTVPLVLLAICAIGLGFIGTPYWPWLQQKLDVHFEQEHASAGLTILSIILVGAGLGLGWFLYGRRSRLRETVEALDPIERAAPGVFAALAARLRFDEFHAATVFRLNAFVAAFADFADRWIWGGAVRAISGLSEFFALTNKQLDEDGINGGFDAASESLRGSGKIYSRAQPGEAHGYLRAIAVGFAVLAMLLVFGGVR